MTETESTELTTVRDILRGKLETLTSSSTALQAAKKLIHSNSSSLLVVDASGNHTGIITERDLVRNVCAFHKRSGQTIVRDIMSSPIITVNLNTSLKDAANQMIQNKVRHLLVLDGAIARGVISADDFASYLKQNIDLDQINTAIIESLLNIGDAGAQ